MTKVWIARPPKLPEYVQVWVHGTRPILDPDGEAFCQVRALVARDGYPVWGMNCGLLKVGDVSGLSIEVGEVQQCSVVAMVVQPIVASAPQVDDGGDGTN